MQEFTTETALQHASDMLNTGSSALEVQQYLQGKGIGSAAAERIIATASEAPLRKQFKTRTIIGVLGLALGLVLLVFALSLQQQQEAQIRQLIEGGEGVTLFNNQQYVLLNDPDRHLIPGRLAFVCAIIGLGSLLSAYGVRKTLKRNQPLIDSKTDI